MPRIKLGAGGDPGVAESRQAHGLRAIEFRVLERASRVTWHFTWITHSVVAIWSGGSMRALGSSGPALHTLHA